MLAYDDKPESFLASQRTKALSLLMTKLDTVDVSIWAARAQRCIAVADGESLAKCFATQRVALAVIQITACDETKPASFCSDQCTTALSYLADLPHSYVRWPPEQPLGGCMGPDTVLATEVAFATETVLAALTEHHDLQLWRLGMLERNWKRNTLPQLQAAVREVLETRNAINF